MLFVLSLYHLLPCSPITDRVWRGTWSQNVCSQQVVSNFRENKRAGEIKNVGRFANESFRQRVQSHLNGPLPRLKTSFFQLTLVHLLS